MGEATSRGRTIPTVTTSTCGFCRRPIRVSTTVDSQWTFEAGEGWEPHVCPEVAILAWKRQRQLKRLGDPRRKGSGDHG